MSTEAEKLAQRFHETYERLAPDFGYKTREASAKLWAEVPEQNKALMIAVCEELFPPAAQASVEGERWWADGKCVMRGEVGKLDAEIQFIAQYPEQANFAVAEHNASLLRVAEAVKAEHEKEGPCATVLGKIMAGGPEGWDAELWREMHDAIIGEKEAVSDDVKLVLQKALELLAKAT